MFLNSHLIRSVNDMNIAYTCYEDCRLLELVFKRYKSNECLGHTGEQGDFSVIGSEFVNFISTAATCRIIKKQNRQDCLIKCPMAI